MRLVQIILCTLVLTFSTALVVEAQNPKRTKVYKKANKKRTKKLKENPGYAPTHKDDDGDGVANYYDHCPKTPLGQSVTTFGCPPDSDQDGIPDSEDPCPDVWGPPKNNGCPYLDSDGDGILDKDDKCPQVAGERRFLGCPDSDGDGIPDSEDNCPNERGSRGNKGCPQVLEANADQDGDGIPDFKDACPTKPGVPQNKGCPEMSQEDKEAIKAAFENLLFETGKDVIKDHSYPSLRKLADVLINNDGTKLRLEGHTDNVGDDDANMDLSNRRAKAVKTFLTNEGVSSSRITAQGFGETRPVDTNDTDEGRRLNRRVEMIIDY